MRGLRKSRANFLHETPHGSNVLSLSLCRLPLGTLQMCSSTRSRSTCIRADCRGSAYMPAGSVLDPAIEPMIYLDRVAESPNPGHKFRRGFMDVFVIIFTPNPTIYFLPGWQTPALAPPLNFVKTRGQHGQTCAHLLLQKTGSTNVYEIYCWGASVTHPKSDCENRSMCNAR